MDCSALLSAWEAGYGQSPVRRGLSLLTAAWPERSPDDWARVAIGERDEYLLRLRESLFGDRLEGLAGCPQCGERLELAFSTTDIRVPAATTIACAGTEGMSTLSVNTDGYDVVCRLPNSLDLIAVTEAMLTSIDERRASLLQRCIVSTRQDGVEIESRSLPPAVASTLAERLAEADPQAAVELALTCPGCGHGWLTAFDILAYLWGEIEDWAQRLLLDVHALASAYGWSERDILAMTPRRRRLYLERLGV